MRQASERQASIGFTCQVLPTRPCVTSGGISPTPVRSAISYIMEKSAEYTKKLSPGRPSEAVHAMGRTAFIVPVASPALPSLVPWTCPFGRGGHSGVDAKPWANASSEARSVVENMGSARFCVWYSSCGIRCCKRCGC